MTTLYISRVISIVLRIANLSISLTVLAKITRMFLIALLCGESESFWSRGRVIPACNLGTHPERERLRPYRMFVNPY